MTSSQAKGRKNEMSEIIWEYLGKNQPNQVKTGKR